MDNSKKVTISSNQKDKSLILNDKIIGRTKHYTPGNKEWNNSVYSFNSSHLRSIIVKQGLANKLIKGHFSIHGLKNIARSQRKRARIIRYSTRKFIVSKPEIKYSNDKVNITVYVFNREKQFYVRKLFFYKRKQKLYNFWVKVGLQTARRAKFLSLVKKRKLEFKPKLTKYKNKHKRVNANKVIPYSGLKFRNERDFFRYKLSYLFNKSTSMSKFHTYSFMFYLLTLLGIKSFITLPDPTGSGSSESNLDGMNLDVLNNHSIEFIKNNFIKTGVISYYDISCLYKIYMKKKYRDVKSLVLRKASKLSHLNAKLQINQLKLTKIIPRLKILISKIYNKKAELNIVSLKHVHLNSDIFTQAIALKLRKKKNILKVMKKSLNLVKVPNDFFFDKKKLSLNKYLDLNLHKNLHLNKLFLDKKILTLNTKDKANTVFNNIFPNNLTNSNLRQDNISVANTSLFQENPIMKTAEVLDTIKFKWVTGVRLEIAGRLTRRNKAARAVFKFKYKGNLKSKQYYVELGSLKKMPTVMLRNNNKVNSQYSFTKSKRRIGSFGIKNWISAY